jgi:hypothetical protein
VFSFDLFMPHTILQLPALRNHLVMESQSQGQQNEENKNRERPSVGIFRSARLSSGTDWTGLGEFEFSFWASLRAGDTAAPIASRAALLAGTNAIYAHLRLLKFPYTHTHEIYSRSMKLHKWPPACHQLGPPGTHGRPRDSFSAGPQNPEEPHPPCNAMRHTTACLSRACLWHGSLLWGEY